MKKSTKGMIAGLVIVLLVIFWSVGIFGLFIGGGQTNYTDDETYEAIMTASETGNSIFNTVGIIVFFVRLALIIVGITIFLFYLNKRILWGGEF